MLPNLVVAIFILLAFFVAASLVRQIFHRLLNRFSENRTVNSILSRTIYIFMILIGVFVALGVLNLEKTVTSLVAGAGVVGIALGFAFQEIASNFIAGIFLAFMKPFRVGDFVEIDQFFGEINRIDIRTTSLMTFDQVEVVIPNKDMFTKTIKNYTSTPKRRLEVKCGISYGEDLEKVRRVVKKALSSVPHRTEEDEVEVYFYNFGNSSIDFRAFIWIEYPGKGNFFRAENQAIMNLKTAFDQEGITIPFPIRTLDFGIKGGVSLKEQMASDPEDQK